MILLWVGTLLAADPSHYALVATVSAPAKGVAVAELPPDVVGAWTDLNRRMMVLGSDGQPLPYTAILSPGPDARETDRASVRPLGDDTYLISAFERPVDSILLDCEGEFAWKVDVTVGDESTPRSSYVWRLGEGGEHLLVPVPRSTGPFRVHLSRLSDRFGHLSGAIGYHILPGIPRLTESFAISEPMLTENSGATYTVALPGPRHIRAIRLIAKDDVFHRQVSVNGSGNYEVQRIQVGGANLDRVEISPLDLQTDQLELEISTDRGLPLTLVGVEIESDRGALLVRNAGEAKVYLGSYEPEEAFDLAEASAELLNAGATEVSLGAFAANPDYVAPPTREGLDQPGNVVEPARQRWSRKLNGDLGWVRVELPPELLEHALPGLSDLRVVDAEGREIPYLVVTGQTGGMEELTFTREEVGTETQIRAKLDRSMVRRVVLETDRGTFSRILEVVRDRGVSTETLRSVEWNGNDRGNRLALDLNQDLGSELMIRIRNGSNAPLPITRISVSHPGASLLTRIPDGGASLWYGAKRVSAPSYDLDLLRTQVLQMQVGTAKLGPEEERGGPVVSGMDKLATVVAMGVLAVGLAGMTLRALMGKKEEDQPIASPPAA